MDDGCIQIDTNDTKHFSENEYDFTIVPVAECIEEQHSLDSCNPVINCFQEESVEKQRTEDIADQNISTTNTAKSKEAIMSNKDFVNKLCSIKKLKLLCHHCL